ncbi:YcxB family protein [Lentibacillus sediminis]|uniref:YcxB family protein n=1 Tax=Lentibacillus sediminis TaxID=1940529 RepID=UPI00130441C2|nr:YcxB family protein [Lentibacillus sediminis]
MSLLIIDLLTVAGALAIAFIFAGPATLGSILLRKRRLRREFESDKQAQNEVTFTINEERIHQKTINSTTEINWSDIFSAYEHKKMFRLYVSRNKVIVLPKRYFHSQQEIELFRDIAKQYVKLK